MYSENSKKEEMLVQDIAALLKKYNPNIEEVYFIPREKMPDHLPEMAVIFKNRDGRYTQCFLKADQELSIAAKFSLFAQELGSFAGAIAAEVAPNSITPVFTDIITQLEDAGETSIIHLEEKAETQQMIDGMGTTLNHVLDVIGDKPARSNRTGFYMTDKLDAIKSMLETEDTPYQVLYESPHCLLCGKAMPERGSKPVLVSSHSDIVKSIKEPYSTLNNGFYHGTYDNMGTNAASVALMLKNELSDNVFFAFTDEEETGRCFGATEAVKWLTGFTGTHPFCVALDVTDEGYYENCLCSIEGLSASTKVAKNIRNAMLLTEAGQKTFCVAKKESKDISPFAKEYISCNYTVFDESAHYAKLKCDTISFCVPTNGSMHSDSGLYIKEPVFLGYCLSLESFLHGYCKDDISFDKYTLAKEMLIDEAATIKRDYVKPFSGYGMGSFIYDHDDDEEEEEESEIISDYFYDSVVEMAAGYSPSEKDCFLSDVNYSYGTLVPQSVASQIFDEVCGIEEDYTYEDFG